MGEMNFQYPELIIKEEVEEEKLLSSEVKENNEHQSDWLTVVKDETSQPVDKFIQVDGGNSYAENNQVRVNTCPPMAPNEENAPILLQLLLKEDIAAGEANSTEVSNCAENTDFQKCWIKEEQISRNLGNEEIAGSSSSVSHAGTPASENSQQLNESANKQFSCEKCKKIYKTVGIYREHMFKRHSIQIPFDCNNCDKSFPTYKELVTHRQKNHNKNLACTVCDKLFRTSDQLNYHSITHTEVRQFNCDLCEMVFSEPSTLTEHKRDIHCEKTEFPCDICSMVFTTEKAFKSHSIKHTFKRKFACNICGKVFPSSGKVKRHVIAVHENMRPYKCDMCPMAFKQNTSLKAHKKLRCRSNQTSNE